MIILFLFSSVPKAVLELSAGPKLSEFLQPIDKHEV